MRRTAAFFAPHRAWAEACYEAMQPFACGAYVNFLQDEGPQRLADAYPAETLERLMRLKRRYDPTNFFRRNNGTILPQPESVDSTEGEQAA